MNINFFSKMTNPVFSNETGTMIDITCDIKEIGEGVVFTASETDAMSYGQELYHNALNGDYGEIAPYVAPEIPAEADLLQARQKTVSELSLDAFALQCAVDAGTASQEQIDTLAALKQNIAERIGENNEVNK
ncbi:TPA: hypothetical protein JL066_002954 [Salmonella enterica]|nr:hypothetical protein [Salmonella enterica subsp. enterica serovar Durham]HAW5564171.1 hypothetical protein [Salmonella enterica]HCM3785797.1 hypothetical protein [Salmonella enterica subsp. enterica serovar Durham]HCM3789964.1 hypothetical protein [Salmonella enterica subsp. enterica serovar Durham]